MTYSYKTNGTCSRELILEVTDGIVESVEFIGGCNGNLKGIAALSAGKPIDEVIEKLSGIRCGFKSTSCPDQLAKALTKVKNKAGD